MILLGEFEDRVATCSEDGTIKIWNIEKGVCTVTLMGHSSDIWCLTAAAFSSKKSTLVTDSSGGLVGQCVEENLVLFSGGNDGSVKTWSVNAHSIACPENPSATLKAISMPNINHNQLPLVVADVKADIGGDHEELGLVAATSTGKPSVRTSRRPNGVSAVRIDPTGQWSVVCLCEGGVWLVDLCSAEQGSERGLGVGTAASKVSESDSVKYPGLDEVKKGWFQLSNLHRGITNADVIFHKYEHQDRDSEIIACKKFLSVVCAHPDGYLTLIETSSTRRVSQTNNSSSSLSDKGKFSMVERSWKGHDLRAINVWHLRTQKDSTLEEKIV